MKENGLLFFIVFTRFSADCAARLLSDGKISAQRHTVVGRCSARIIYPARSDSDFYLPKYGLQQHLVFGTSGGSDFDVFHGRN